MGSVFLFNMGVVVVLVGPAAGELDLLSLAIGPEVMVDELTPII